MALAAVLAILTLLPYAYAHLASPPGRVFMGFFFLGDDANTYLAKMREGWDGQWLWTNRYTTESSPPVYFFVYWLALGKLAAILHLPLLGMFHLARVAGAFLLLYAAWVFIEHFIEEPRARRFAIVFLAFGLGLGWVLQLAGKPVLFGAQTEPGVACRQALRASGAMIARVEEFSRSFGAELDGPLRLGNFNV